MTDWWLRICAASGTLAAIALLYRSWSRRPHGSPAMVAGAWALLGVAAAFWIAVDGWEFGTIYALTAPSVVALPMLWLVADRRSGRLRTTPRWPLRGPPWPRVRANLLTFLLVIVLGMVASTLITAAVGLLLPFGEIDQLVFIACTMPAVWGLTAFWLSMDARRRRPTLALVVLSAVSLLSILIL